MCPLGGTDDDVATFDPRGAIALARVNWLHGRYRIVSEAPYLTLSRADIS